MHSSKIIDISKSSLVSLRAELARKKDEVALAKSQPKPFVPVPRVKKETIFTRKNPGVGDREVKDHEEDKEEQDLLKKSREALESKTKLYDKLAQSGSNLDEEDNARYLVDFQQKDFTVDLPPAKTFTPVRIADEPVPPVSDDEEGRVYSDSDDNVDPDDDWVDYTDCLGRTRRCLRRDLADMKKQDTDLSGTLGYEPDKVPPKPYVPPLYEECREGDRELLSADMRREMMREKWEEQERELKDRMDVHYQDVLFDEARAHGVGYYGFSGDEEQRRAQQEALTKLREETRTQQESTRAQRERRQKQLDARLKAANLRKRIRMGLPPEEDPTPVEETVAPAAPEVAAVAEEKPEPSPKKRQTVRPWDLGKEGVKEIVEMSQDEWVKKRRNERDSEFAPPQAYQEDRFASRSSTKKSKAPTQSPFRAMPQEDKEEEPPAYQENRFASRASTKKSKSTHAAGSASFRPTPMVDEVDVPPSTSTPVERPRGTGPEVAPPPTFEYHGPSGSGARRPRAEEAANLADSFLVGLRYLREQADQRQKQKEKGLLDIV